MTQVDARKPAARILLLTTPRSYRLDAFLTAADRLGVEVVTGMDLPPELAGQWPDALALDFRHVEAAAAVIGAYHARRPLAAILSVDDSGSLLAARASTDLGLPHNAPEAAEAARDKYLMRRMLAQAGALSPNFRRFTTQDDPTAIARTVSYPCVVKPINLNGSRGVIRADDPDELVAAVARLARMLKPSGPGEPSPFLVEDYIPGVEVALEGLLHDGVLQVLALFDKPDPLDGPFFEETIYVTPSRLPDLVQESIVLSAGRAARALGLHTGPVHAELRVNERGAWIVEIAGRSIGGLCSQVLRFGLKASLEELILRQACGPPPDAGPAERCAAGVMMIPIPSAGLLRSIRGVEEASAVPLIEGVEITAALNYPLTPLPEGDSYLGFIFARGDAPEEVEAALRTAHSRLQFEIEPLLALIPA